MTAAELLSELEGLPPNKPIQVQIGENVANIKQVVELPDIVILETQEPIQRNLRVNGGIIDLSFDAIQDMLKHQAKLIDNLRITLKGQ